MSWKDFIDKPKSLIDSLSHFKRLSKVAGQRSFLLNERKKFLMKLGEKSLELLEVQKIQSDDLARLVEQIKKIEKLLKAEDYGGLNGVSFAVKRPKKIKRRRTKPSKE